MHMRTFVLVHMCTKGIYAKQQTQSQAHTHQINTAHICGRSSNTATTGVRNEDLTVVRPLSKSQNTTEVCLRVRQGIGSLSKYPHTQFLYLLSINLSINPLLMGQLWVSASHLRDANQDHKLRDQPLGQRCSSASEWLFKHGDARIDFSSSLKEKREGEGRSVLHQPGSVSAVAICESGREPSPGPQSPSADQGA